MSAELIYILYFIWRRKLFFLKQFTFLLISRLLVSVSYLLSCQIDLYLFTWVIKFVFEFDFKVYVITYTPIPVVFEKLVLTTKSIELRDVLWLGGGGVTENKILLSFLWSCPQEWSKFKNILLRGIDFYNRFNLCVRNSNWVGRLHHILLWNCHPSALLT
jgi:hypothetical protein